MASRECTSSDTKLVSVNGNLTYPCIVTGGPFSTAICDRSYLSTVYMGMATQSSKETRDRAKMLAEAIGYRTYSSIPMLSELTM